MTKGYEILCGYICHFLLFFAFTQETAYGTALNGFDLPTIDFESPPVLTPKFISRGQSYRAVIGDTILLPCQVQDLGTNILLWRRGSSVVTAAQLMITRDSRFQLLENSYSLQIRNVRPQDAGDYICQIGDQENRDLVHTVEILVPPSVRANPDNGHVTARKGGSVTLECKASGNPVPTISWIKKDQAHGSPKLGDGPKLSLDNLDRQNSGVYRCIATNGVREPVHVDVKLNVLSPPEVNVEKSWVHGGEGYEAQLICIVQSDTNAVVSWYQDSFNLEPTDRRTMDDRGDKHILMIRNIQHSDFGNYSCIADNSLGRAKKYIELSGRPGPAQFHSPLYSRTKNTYNLTWSIESAPPLEEIRLLYRKLMMNESFQHPGKWHDVILTPTTHRSEAFHHIMTYTIKGLENNAVYEAIVQAKNRYGWNEVSDIHQFYTQNNELPTEDVEYLVRSTTYANGNLLAINRSLISLLLLLIGCCSLAL